MTSSDETILLFSYGTLQQENVQQSTFGRRLSGEPDVLPGFTLSAVRITDPHVIATSGLDVHHIATASGNPSDRIPGTLFRITAAELDAADRYEVGDYRRIRVRLESGAEAFLYVAGDGRDSRRRGR